MRSPYRLFSTFLATVVLVAATPSLHAGAAPETLRAAAADRLHIGCPVGQIDLDNPELLALVRREFNCITIETELMPFKLGKERDALAFEGADRVLAWAERHGLPVYGHMLVWDYRTPRWLFQNEAGELLPRESGLANLRWYIHSVMTHFKGRIAAWNVVNEAISDEPGEFLRDTLGRRCIGDDYVDQAFAFAHEADPEVALYYNDYNVVVPEKREKVRRLVRALRENGRRVDAVGLQGHWMPGFPELAWIDQTIEAFAADGFKVMVTELDVDVLPRTTSGANMQTVEYGPDPYRDGLPEDVQQELATRYGDIFARLLRHPSLTMITFWGSHDGRSWLNDFPVIGRTNHPLLFDRELQRKPAHAAVLQAFAEANALRALPSAAEQEEPELVPVE